MNDPRRVEAALAANLRDWRTRRGWSQAELARRAGLSKGMLVQVEQAQTNPSIATLCKLANALGVALVALVEAGDEPVVRRVTADDIAWLWRGRSKASAGGLVAGVEAPVPVELWEWRIGAGDGYDAIAHPAGTREFVYVLEGDAAVTVDGVEVVAAGRGVRGVPGRSAAPVCRGPWPRDPLRHGGGRADRAAGAVGRASRRRARARRRPDVLVSTQIVLAVWQELVTGSDPSLAVARKGRPVRAAGRRRRRTAPRAAGARPR